MIKKFFQSREFKELFKYGLVGFTSTIIDLGFLYVFVEFAQIAVIPASIMSFLIAVVNGFIWNKTWTFKDNSRNYRNQFLKFFTISSVGLILNTCFMLVFYKIFGIWYMLAKIITSAFVFSWNFLGNKLWTFRVKSIQPWSLENPVFELSIVIPAYNEAKRIPDTIQRIFKFIKNQKINAEILVINDGSKDSTAKIINEMAKNNKTLKLVSYERNQGKGFAVKTGVLHAKGQAILISDADNSTPIEEVLKLLPYLKQNFDVVIGSRYLPGSDVKIKQGKLRIFISRVGNLVIRTLLVGKIRDTQCGFKLFEYKTAKEIFQLQKIYRWSFDVEILAIAQKLKHRIKEVPIIWSDAAGSKVHPFRDAYRTIKEILYIKFNLITGRYFLDK